MKYLFYLFSLVILIACNQNKEEARNNAFKSENAVQQQPKELTVIDTMLNAEAKLGNRRSGKLTEGDMYAQGGIGLWSDNESIEENCQIYSYEVTRIDEKGNIETAKNKGARFGGNASRLQGKVLKGDIYRFENILIHCDDKQGLYKVNDLRFEIK